MHFAKALGASLLAASLALGSVAFAQDADEAHHPDANGAAGSQDGQMPMMNETKSSDKPSGGMMGKGMMGGGMMGKGMMGGHCPMMGMGMGGGGGSTHAAGRVAFLKAELEITDAQQAAFDAYAAALKKNLESMHAMRGGMMKKMMGGSAPDRLDARIGAMEKRLSALKEIRPALDKFYATLSDAQKKKADEMLMGMGCMM
jgi:hypothetical protein